MNQVNIMYLINSPIVTVVMGNMLWDPNNLNGQMHWNMMSLFEDCTGDMEAPEDGEGKYCYYMTIKNLLKFRLDVDYVLYGVRFRHADWVLQSTKERNGLAIIGLCNVATIANYSLIFFAFNLHNMSEMLEMVWTLLIAMDMSNYMSMLYLDVFIRLHLDMIGIINMNFLAIPVYDLHTIDVIFDTVTNSLDALYL